MRVVLVNAWPLGPTPEAHLAHDDLRRELARALVRRGLQVHVVQELATAGHLDDHGVAWHFVPPGAPLRLARAALTTAGRDDASVKLPAPHLARAAAALAGDVVHSFDLVAYPLLAALGRDARRRGAALVTHFHGGAPARVAALRRVERAAFADVGRFGFTTRAHAAPWVRSGALADDARVVEVFEVSSHFTPGDRAAARAATGLRGAPAVLHLGRLDAVKDPLTVVAGFRTALAALPHAELSFAWTDAPLLDAVRTAAAGLPVHWLGPQPRPQVEALLRGADVLVQASTREVCGRAVLEAFATGTPCVLSDIPSFRRLTDHGRVGALFPPGDDGALAAALRQTDFPALRASVRDHFDAALSYERLADDVVAMYREARA